MPTQTTLTIQRLTMRVSLGWTESERAIPQTIALTIQLRLAAPHACKTDQLADTICYHTLIDTLRTHIEQRSYRLIESLGADCYQLIKQQVMTRAMVTVTIQKWPAIEGLTEGVCFSYGDSS